MHLYSLVATDSFESNKGLLDMSALGLPELTYLIVLIPIGFQTGKTTFTITATKMDGRPGLILLTGKCDNSRMAVGNE